MATSAGSIQVAQPDELREIVHSYSQLEGLLNLKDDLRAAELLFFQISRRAKQLIELGKGAGCGIEDFDRAYRLLPAESTGRSQLLACLATIRSGESLKLFADLIAEDPPLDERQAVLAFAPLVDNHGFAVDAVFPKLMEAIKYRHFAGLVLDLANYVTRKQFIAEHPATESCKPVDDLAGPGDPTIGVGLKKAKSKTIQPKKFSQKVNESVALAVSLCDALALIGHDDAVGKICQAMSLKHRRVKTEAAAALIKLGDIDEQSGRQQLIGLAEEPVARIRVISYCEELGLLGENRGRISKRSSNCRSPAGAVAGCSKSDGGRPHLHVRDRPALLSLAGFRTGH